MILNSLFYRLLVLTNGPMVVAANCCGVNGAGGGEYFRTNHGFVSLFAANVGTGYVSDRILSCVGGATSYLLLPRTSSSLVALVKPEQWLCNNTLCYKVEK